MFVGEEVGATLVGEELGTLDGTPVGIALGLSVKTIGAMVGAIRSIVGRCVGEVVWAVHICLHDAREVKAPFALRLQYSCG